MRARPSPARASAVIATVVLFVLCASCLATPARAAQGSDWEHALRVAQDLRVHPPASPVVLLLGGSCARESTVSDASWSAALTQGVGAHVVAYNLASRNQTFEQDIALVKALPRIDLTILVGVNRGRFTSPPTTTSSTTPHATKGVYAQHHYTGDKRKTLAQKEALVTRWMRDRYPVFKQRHAANLRRLDELVGVCARRGYRVAIVDLPQDMAVIGHAFDAPIAQYRDGCRTVAAKHGVPFFTFAQDVGLTNRDFYDLDHLLETGRPKYQRGLTAATVKLLPARPGRAGGVDTALVVTVTAVALLVAGGAVQRRRVVVRRRRRARRRAAARNLQSMGLAPGTSVPASMHPRTRPPAAP